MAARPLVSTWMIYTRERYPLIVYLLLSAGYVLTGWAAVKAPLSWSALAFGMVYFLVFFYVLRLMDEIKDVEKDKLAHPERPLARGLLSITECRRAVRLLIVIMLSMAMLSAYAFNAPSGALLALSSLYLWLMYKEFYVGPRLGDFPLLYAISHQIISVPLLLFSAYLFAHDALDSPHVLPAALLILGAFFCYEVCRKLDPHAHPVLKTYLTVYGRPRTILIVAGAAAVAGFGAWRLGIALPFWSFEAALLASFLLPAKRYKITESVATLNLAVHMLGLPLLRLIGQFQP